VASEGALLKEGNPRGHSMDRRRFMTLLGSSTALTNLSAIRPSRSSSPNDKRSGRGEEISEQDANPIAIHPENPKYFLFRGKPIVLVAATEHYGSVVNRRFDFMRYLEEAADKKQTLTRLFLLFRELQSARNPYSPLKPDSPDFVAPYPRRGPLRAMDGEPIYDLDEWNGEYFDRLHRFLTASSDLGIVVELTLFSNSYSDQVWALNPLRDKNNLQRIGAVEWQEYASLKNPELVARQIAFAQKIVQETSGFDNVYYEISNEPGGGLPGHVTPLQVDEWQEKLAEVIRGELQKLNRRHLVVGQNAFSYAPHFSQKFDDSFSGSMLDAVNVHPLPNLIVAGRTYQLGNFMSKELQLGEFRDFFLAINLRRKPAISDEDNAASLYRDDVGWTIHRKRAWTAVMCGAHYDYIDFSIQSGREAGTEESRRKIRSWMRYLSEFIHSFDFIHARPAPDWIANPPSPLVVSALIKEAKDYVAYLADGREISDPGCGHPVSGEIMFSVPEGTYDVRTYSPAAGVYSRAKRISGGNQIRFELPTFEHDIVLRVTREAAGTESARVPSSQRGRAWTVESFF